MVKYKTIELFAGAGGLALGLEKAGIESKYLIEIDKYASSTLQKNRKNWNIINQDIKIFLNDINKYDLSDIDIISGGFPCQPFSYAGKKLGIEDSRGTLFYDFVQVVMKVKPKIILAENVKGLLNHDYGKTWKVIKSSFEECGYRVFYKVLNSWDYEVAQKRERLILIGVRNDIKEDYVFPVPMKYKPVLKDVLIDVPKSEGYKYPDNKKKVFDLVPPGGCHRDLPEDIAKEYMGASYYLGGGRTGIARRISWNEPCLTLTTSPMQKQTDRCHPDESRPFTIREYARIQSFPDSWEFQGGIGVQYKQIGNAVPVNMAYHIGKSIISFLDKLKIEVKMNKYNLDFISDDNLFNHVKDTVQQYRSLINLEKFNSNIIDPIKLLFDSKVYNKSFEEIIQLEVARQIDKSNNNQIGYFHQNIFKYIGDDEWFIPKKGFDIVNEKKKIFVEMKNKHNTMNSSSSQKTYINMQSKIIENPDSQCLLVEVIAKNSQNIPWQISLNGNSKSCENIRRVSIDKFYEIVTGNSLSFYSLCEVLPKVLDDVLKHIDSSLIEDSVLDEIKALYPETNLLKTLYLLAFNTYEGFK